MDNDTIPVRPDEKFDEEQLKRYLHGRLPGSDKHLQVRQFGGGAANLTYLLDYGSYQYALRRPPLGPVAKSAHDMDREYRVLSVLYQSYSLAPRAYLFCQDLEVIGAPFFVMERREGLVVRRELPLAFKSIVDAPQKMSFALVDALADFHAVDYQALGLVKLGEPEGFIERQIEGWYRRWRVAKIEDIPDMDAVYSWLKRNKLPLDYPCLVHNDYKLDNVMFAPGDPGRMVAVFDWDMCTLGDPLSDLGALLTYWTEPDDPPYLQAIARTFMPVGDSRFPTRNELVRQYAIRSGRDVSQIHFYHVLGLFRVAVIIAQIFIRFHRGQTKDQRFAAFGKLVPLIARAAYDML